MASQCGRCCWVGNIYLREKKNWFCRRNYFNNRSALIPAGNGRIAFACSSLFSIIFVPLYYDRRKCLSLFPQKLTKEGRDERWLVWFRRRKYRSIDGSPEIFISNSIFFPTKNTIFYTTYIILEFVGRSFPCLGSRTATGFTVMKNRACNHERVVPRLASKNHEIYYRPPR